MSNTIPMFVFVVLVVWWSFELIEGWYKNE